jgi:hypothetical protein
MSTVGEWNCYFAPALVGSTSAETSIWYELAVSSDITGAMGAMQEAELVVTA